jgi:hypothetical protein
VNDNKKYVVILEINESQISIIHTDTDGKIYTKKRYGHSKYYQTQSSFLKGHKRKHASRYGGG